MTIRERHQTIMAQKLEGIWAAIPTPFQADGALNLDGTRANAQKYVDHFGCDGVFCNGIMGEGWALTADERQESLAAILDGAEGRLNVGVVVTHHAPRETLALCRHAGKAGAHHAILMRPRGQYRDVELVAFGEAAADAAGLPLVLFESPAPGMSFGANVIETLAQKGLVLAVKAPGGDKAVAALRRQVGDAALICNPHEDQLLTELARSPNAPLYANPEPYLYQSKESQPIRAYRDALCGNETSAAHALWRKLSPLRIVYDRWVIGRLDHGLSPVPALKHWARRMGLETGPVRFPLQPLSAAAAQALDADIDAAGVPK
jgi:4-hydroxy-tetrahydrodipicolinate synthase